MLALNKISVEEYNNYFVNKEHITINELPSWYDANKYNYDIIGIYNDSELVGVTLVKLNKGSARALVMVNYDNINEIKDAIKNYYQDIVYFRIMCSIGIDVSDLKKIDSVTYQKLYLTDNINEQYKLMNDNATRNIKSTINNGVGVEKIGFDDISRIEKIIATDEGRVLNKDKIMDIINYYQYNAVMYVSYIEKQDILKVIKLKINQVQKEIDEINKLIVNNSSVELGDKKDIAVKRLVKYQDSLKRASNFEDKVDIGFLIAIYGDDEVYEIELGIDDAYKEFSPVYAIYNTLINEAIDSKYKAIIFNEYKGVISNSGIFTVRKNLGSKIVKCLGMYDIPIKKLQYKLVNKDSGD